MKVCLILLASLVLVSLAQKMDPVTCDWEKEMMCPGEWTEDWSKQTSPDYCIPNKVGDCANNCPVKNCGKDEMVCSGYMDNNGCKTADFCNHGKFCPAYCDFEKEQHCSGEKDPKTGDLTTPDTCIPMYDENGCWNQCQTTCPANADGQWCTKQDSNGCELGWCDSGKFCPPDCNWEKQQVCPGKVDPKTGDQTSADYCMSKEDGNGCTIHCPSNCGEKEILCPGKLDTVGCKEPDYCYHSNFCPVDCDWEKEMMCPGPWDPKTGEQTGPDTCMPHKIGECNAHCPMTCKDSDMMCPGMTHSDGCKDADFCISGKFCPVYCDSEKEQHCSGDWDPKTGEQITADTCIPKYDADGCWNQCQTTCPADADGQWCTKQDTNGCESGWCHSGKFCPADCNWEKQQVCPGKMDPKTGEQTSADYCFSKEDGNGCPIHCSINCGEKETLCPGKVDAAGCKEPDYCYPGKFCPVNCDWEKEMSCPGQYDPKTGEKITADTCMPMKTGDCQNYCPKQCMEHEHVCNAKDENGCLMPDTCFPEKENCPGDSDPECKNNWSDKKCQKQKEKGRCGKSKVAKNCQKTCEKC